MLQLGRSSLRVAIALLVAVLTGCTVSGTETEGEAPQPSADQLQPGDPITVSVEGEPELSKTYQLDRDGRISLPRAGVIDAGELTPAQVEEQLAELLVEGGQSRPEVRVARAAPRPIFVHGGVERPGSYVFRDDLTVEAAIASAGGAIGDIAGYDVLVAQPGGAVAARVLSLDAALAPGDVIELRKRGT